MAEVHERSRAATFLALALLFWSYVGREVRRTHTALCVQGVVGVLGYEAGRAGCELRAGDAARAREGAERVEDLRVPRAAGRGGALPRALWLALGAPERALAAVHAARAADPTLTEAQLLVARLELARGSPSTALEAFETAWDQLRPDPELALEIARALEGTGRAAEAQAWFREAAALRPGAGEGSGG